MIALIQRVTEASVSVGGKPIAAIGPGLLVLVGVEKGDSDADANRLATRVLAYRVFPDEDRRMNLSLADTGGSLLLIPQFTLAADTSKGLRPGFASAADPEHGRRLFASMLGYVRRHDGEVGCGEFGADMQVALVNDGPVTFWLRVPPEKG